MTKLSRAEFHNSHGVAGMTNDACVRATGSRQPSFCWVSFPRSAELKSETFGPEQRRNRRADNLGGNELPSRVIIIRYRRYKTRQYSTAKPGLWAPLIIGTPACSHTLGWLELTRRAVPATRRVNHIVSAVSKQSFIPSITPRSALCSRLCRCFCLAGKRLSQTGTQW